MSANILDIVIICPHCKDPILIEQLNCGIFRHGSYKHNGQQIDPHANKETCDQLLVNGLIFGCGKPFQTLHNSDGSFKIVICDYI
jgi:hypothetical protein